jgi:gas vesicle protein
MVFDVISFLAGVAAGAVTGALAGVLHGLESTADLQERLRQVTKEVERLGSTFPPTDDPTVGDARSKLEGLHRDLEEIHEEIRRMYRRASR